MSPLRRKTPATRAGNVGRLSNRRDRNSRIWFHLFNTVIVLASSQCFSALACCALPIATLRQEAANVQIESSAQTGDDRGKAIYLERCAACHGVDGRGTERYDEPLEGSWTLADLIGYIDESMPEDNPEACRGADARDVARYLFETFYASEAKPTAGGAELPRLTVRQFRESVADLSLAFAKQPWRSKEFGLKGYYFAARNWTENRKLSEQIDARLDFGAGVPHFDPTGEYPSLPKPEKPPENLMNEGFSVYWFGSLLAARTGVHEIIVRSKNGFRVWLNGDSEPLIDRKVRSDDVEEHRAQIFLLADRAYPLKIEFFSYPDPPARITLSWRPPEGVEEIIPKFHIVPHVMSESLAVATTFPPDDASWGFERGTSVSREWQESVVAAAIEAADWFADRLWALAHTRDVAENRAAKVQTFCRQFVEFAFCRKLNEEEVAFFVTQHFGEGLSLKDSARRVILLTLTSPRFLFPTIETRNRDFEIARRLALLLWDSVPDRQLFELADQGKLSDATVATNEIYRMLDHPRGRSKLRSALAAWLNLDKPRDWSRDPQRFAGFTPAIVVDLRRSLDRQVDEIVWSESSDFRRFFGETTIFANGRMADYYGLERQVDPAVDPEDFVPIDAGDRYRGGLLTHPYTLARLAYFRDSSPIHRGVFVARNLLGRTLRPPTENFEPLSEDFAPHMTNRQRVEHQTADNQCMKCHQVINPLGFSLENYDAVGRYRSEDQGRPIDASAIYRTEEGNEIALANAGELAQLVVNEATAHRNFIRHVFRELTRTPIESFDGDLLGELQASFVEKEYHIRELVVEIAKRQIWGIQASNTHAN